MRGQTDNNLVLAAAAVLAAGSQEGLGVGDLVADQRALALAGDAAAARNRSCEES